MKRVIISVLVLLTAGLAQAQSFFDALEYSQTGYGGTARSVAMGSAFGALGGDFISASINPAGLGLYSSSEFCFSPTLNINNIKTTYLGTTNNDDKYNFNFNNISYVGNIKTNIESGIVSVTFGIGYNQLKNFNSNVLVEGYNARTSLLNYYTDWANSISDPYYFDYHNEGLAWNTWLIDYSDSDGAYYNDFNITEEKDADGNITAKYYNASTAWPHYQRKVVSTSGRINEYAFSTAVNVNHRLYIGASLGLLDLEYYEDASFTETDNQDQNEYFSSYTLTSNLHDSGVGVNFKAGVIWKPIKPLRIGASIHTPNFYKISTNSTNTINAYYDVEVGTTTNASTHWQYSNNQHYSYRLETPMRAELSAAYQLGKIALISADYEYLNYNAMKFRDSGDDYDYTDQNSEIQNVFNPSNNIRIGAEVRATPNVSLRAGYSITGNPWKKEYTTYDETTQQTVTVDLANNSDTQSSISAGFGYRQQSFFIDFAYRLTMTDKAYKVHEMSYNNTEYIGKNIADYSGTNNQATLTFGFRF